MSFEILKYKDLEIKIYFKKIRSLNIRVNHYQEIKISVPKRTSKKEIENFIESKYEWLILSLKKFEKDAKYHIKKYEVGESHFLFGKEYKLSIIQGKEPKIIFKENLGKIYLSCKSNISEKTKEKIINKWYQEKLMETSKEYFDKWEKILGVTKNDLIIKKMKGKWGYCMTKSKKICLNLELAKRKLDFVEYVVLHELCHLIYPNHGQEFKALLDKHLPSWRSIENPD
jgi:predicted metal-dependent hydrolase